MRPIIVFLERPACPSTVIRPFFLVVRGESIDVGLVARHPIDEQVCGALYEGGGTAELLLQGFGIEGARSVGIDALDRLFAGGDELAPKWPYPDPRGVAYCRHQRADFAKLLIGGVIHCRQNATKSRLPADGRLASGPDSGPDSGLEVGRVQAVLREQAIEVRTVAFRHARRLADIALAQAHELD